MAKAIFWDMDGTMVDSEPLWGIATLELSDVMGRRITPEQRELTVGSSLGFVLDLCAQHAGIELDDELRDHYRGVLFERMNQLLETRLELNPGVQDLLGDLQRHRVPMLVTTNTQREMMGRYITAIGGHFFTDTITGDEVENPKPAPDMYIEASRRSGADPSECLVFEDSWNGMTAAVAAGCKVIGVLGEEDPYPDGVTPLSTLNGRNSFEGVSASDIFTWFGRL